MLSERVVRAAMVGVADDQRQRVDDGLMRGVVGSELQHAEQPDQAAAVVIGVGRLEDLALLTLVLRAGRAVLVDEVGQRRLAADDGVDHLTHAVVGRLQGRFGDLAEHRVLAADAAEILDELRDDLLLGTRVDAVDRRDQQLRERVSDLPLAHHQQRAQQRELRRLRMLPQMAGRLDRRAGAPARNDDRGDVGEEVRRQPDRADRLKLCDLDEHRVKAHVARRRLDQRQAVLCVVVVIVGDGDQCLEALDRSRLDACRDPAKQRVLGATQRRPRDLADAVGGWRLDQLRTAAGKQLRADAMLATLDRCDVLGQPRRQRFGVRDAALPEARVGADLGAVALRRAAGEVIRRKLTGADADLAGEMRDSVIGQILRPGRETPAPQHMLQQDRESQARRAGLIAQQLQLVADQGEVIDDVVETQVARHLKRRLGRSASSRSCP